MKNAMIIQTIADYEFSMTIDGKNGHDAEVRRDKDGNFVVYSVKKQRADKIQVK